MVVASVQYRIPYGDVDKMGYVYYANYFRYFEILRNELIRKSSVSYKEMEENYQLMLPVLDAYCEYLFPAKYDDLITIQGWVSTIEANRIKIEYLIVNQESKKIATGYTTHICLNSEGKPRKLPNFIQNLAS
ncbi:MAG: acyl-CoA thioesterase [Leptonema sp. (in: bacteria)]